MTAITTFFSHQPMFALFFTIAAGYLLGAVSVKGLSLGSGAVLFVGLPHGAKFCPECGHRTAQQVACRACSTTLQPGTKFCTECGERQA